MDKQELLARTKHFALRILRVTEALPNNVGGRAIANQIVRSGMSVGANYRAACRARSRAEFAAKLGVVAEEADETVYWLELITEGEFAPKARVEALLREAHELTAIFTAGRRSAKKNQTSNIKPQT